METPITRIARWFVQQVENCESCHKYPRTQGLFCSAECEADAAFMQQY